MPHPGGWWDDQLGDELRLRLWLSVLLARSRDVDVAGRGDLVRALGVPAEEITNRTRELARALGPAGRDARQLRDRLGADVRAIVGSCMEATGGADRAVTVWLVVRELQRRPLSEEEAAIVWALVEVGPAREIRLRRVPRTVSVSGSAGVIRRDAPEG